MATPNVGILTTSGKALIDKVNSGQAKISFSKIVFSSMDNSQLPDMQVKALTAIAPQEVVVSSPETTLDTNSGETRIRATGTNEKLADGVYVKTYGVFAKDDTGSEILYGVTVSPNPNYFPAYDGVTPQAVTYSYKTVIQETSNITMTNSNDVYASQEDLTEALQPYAKTVDVNQQLDKKVNIADMRKPASDVAGIEEVNTLQTQVNNSAVGTNLLLGTGNSSSVTGTNITNQVMYTYFLANRYNVSSLVSALGTRFTISYDWSVSGSSPSGTFNLVWNAFPWGHGIDALNTVSSSNTSGHFSRTFNLSTDIKSVANTINFRLDNFVGTLKVSNMKLEKGSVATDWCPNPKDKVNVADMRKPASDVAGIEEVNAKQDKIGYTPADDSKVVHDNHDGTEQLNGVQVQPFNKLSDVTSLRNIVLQTDNVIPHTAKGKFGETVQDFYLYSGFSSLPSGTQVYYSYDLVVTNADGGVHWLGWGVPWSAFVNNQHLTTDGIHHFQGTTTIPDATSNQFIHSTIDNSHATYQLTNLMIVVGSIPVTHLPAPEDVARTSQQTNFTAGLQSGGINVATAADLNNYYHANDSDSTALAAAKSANVPGIFWFEEV